jgi:hypothetical protein
MNGSAGGNEARAIGQLTKNLKASLVTEEAPNQLVIRAEVTGLPKYREALPLIRENAPRR